MGTLATGDFDIVREYGHLAIRFNGLRFLYTCSAQQLRDHKAPEDCLKKVGR